MNFPVDDFVCHAGQFVHGFWGFLGWGDEVTGVREEIFECFCQVGLGFLHEDFFAVVDGISLRVEFGFRFGKDIALESGFFQ